MTPILRRRSERGTVDIGDNLTCLLLVLLVLAAFVIPIVISTLNHHG